MALSDDELEVLLRTGEADRVERKRNAADLDRIREAICAFANDLPGYRLPGVVFVGVEDNGTCAGITVDDELLKRLATTRDDGSITPFPSLEVRRATLQGCELAAIIVLPSENPPIRTRGRAWIRVGPRRAIATPEDERRLIEKRRWGNLPFDAQPVSGASLQDLDLTRFALEYLPLLVDQQTIAQNQRTTPQQLRALRRVGIDEIPTTTAVLMLGKSPQDWFAGAFIQWRRVANAVMHRTYDGSNAPTRVTWYADRVEILSPGGLYGTVTPQNFGQPGITDYRNPTLAEALKAYGFVERFGQGLEIVRQALATNGNPPVEFQLQPPEAPTWVHAVVRKSP